MEKVANELSRGGAIKILSRIFGIAIGLIGILTIAGSLFILKGGFYAKFLAYLSYAGMDLVLAYGLWKNQKWVISLLGFSGLLMFAVNILKILQIRHSPTNTLVSLLIMGALFLYAYASKAYFVGEFVNKKVFAAFVLLLIISQVTFYF